MTTLRVATYNIEWMNNLFVPGKPEFRKTQGKAMGRNPKDVLVVAERVAGVIKDLNAHIIGVQEGPSKLEQLQFFVDEFLDGKYKVSGVPSGAQSVYAMVRKDSPVKATPYTKDDVYYKRLLRPAVFQPWGEVNKGVSYKMARAPALLRLGIPGQDDPVHFVVAHTKSQFVKGFSRKLLEAREPAAMYEAILARQKLSADIAALRRHVTNAILERKNASGVILVGDLNDGFSKGIFESEFLMQSLVDELRGSFRRQSALLDHAMDEAMLRNKDTFTVEFRSEEKKGITRELIDHILVTPALSQKGFWLRLKKGSARVEHDVSKKHTKGTGATGDDRPSDHIPVTAEFTLS